MMLWNTPLIMTSWTLRILRGLRLILRNGFLIAVFWNSFIFGWLWSMLTLALILVPFLWISMIFFWLCLLLRNALFLITFFWTTMIFGWLRCMLKNALVINVFWTSTIFCRLLSMLKNILITFFWTSVFFVLLLRNALLMIILWTSMIFYGSRLLFCYAYSLITFFWASVIFGLVSSFLALPKKLMAIFVGSLKKSMGYAFSPEYYSGQLEVWLERRILRKFFFVSFLTSGVSSRRMLVQLSGSCQVHVHYWKNVLGNAVSELGSSPNARLLPEVEDVGAGFTQNDSELQTDNFHNDLEELKRELKSIRGHASNVTLERDKMEEESRDWHDKKLELNTEMEMLKEKMCEDKKNRIKGFARNIRKGIILFTVVLALVHKTKRWSSRRLNLGSSRNDKIVK